ncbi:rhodanese-like domain-containing protein [Thiofilum flexile]|uniref:rhodanese-like domain-containing protein n=1 Tax=Thiofilum flexile TaxID=125627 RepID=UPI00036ED991|nr:rhodanese-like domain-containing protein [Thiofilum flexile]
MYTLIRLKISLILLSIICLQPAHAIPPPDVLMSLWQSALQFIGMISVVLAGAALTLKQFFSHYLIGWKRDLMLGILMLSLFGIGVWWFSANNSADTVHAANTSTTSVPPAPQPLVNTPPQANKPVLPKGEKLAVGEILKREKDEYTRNWKIETLGEMQQEAQMARKAEQLPALKPVIIESFTPQALYKLLQTERSQFYLLDVREGYERSQFTIQHDAIARYGDLIHDIIPPNLARNKLIVLLCHSGIRGYLAANALHAKGYSNIAFLQGGMAAWNEAKLPINGNANYSLQPKSLKILSKQQFKALGDKNFTIQIDTNSPAIKGIKNLTQLPFETASTTMLQKIYQQAGNKPIALVCNTYGGCFHGLNMSYLLKQAGKQYVGIYDDSKQWLTQYE